MRIGVVGTAAVFPFFGDAARARVQRANQNGGIAGRQIEIVDVVDDQGDPDVNLATITAFVEEQEVFAVVVASTALTADNALYLEQRQVPFVGWGFSGAFCLPNAWGFGFNGCLNATAFDAPGAVADPGPAAAVRQLIADQGVETSIGLITSDGPSGDAALTLAEETWGDDLIVTARIADAADAEEEGDDTRARAVEDIVEAGPAVALIKTGIEDARSLKVDLRSAGYAGLMVDDVSYLPGLLADVVTASQLEGSYSITQFPAQEELRLATQQVYLDLLSIDAAGPNPETLQLTHGHTIGYWSTDLLVAMLDETGSDLDTGTFFDAVVVEGFTYDPGLDGGFCPINTDEIHQRGSGGAAIVQVLGGIYQPAVRYRCWEP